MVGRVTDGCRVVRWGVLDEQSAHNQELWW